MDVVTIHAAKTRLSHLIARVEAGEEIVLARGKTHVAKLVPVASAGKERQFGALRGVMHVNASFFDPLTEAELAAWER